MSTIKLESVNSATFLVSGKAYSKGDYLIRYTESSNNSSGVVAEGIKSLVSIAEKFTGVRIVSDALFTDFVDSTGTVYGTFDIFTKALQALINPGTGVATDLISDKGVVTQITTIATAVELNTVNGIVTTVSSTLAADTSASFTVTNSKVFATSNVQLTPLYSGTGVVHLEVVSTANGSFVVKITNIGTAVLNNVVKVQFLVA